MMDEAAAKLYVATDEVSGQLQLEILKQEGCLSTSKVLEIGCGCLHLGIPLIQYLDRGNYVGVDPNAWLREVMLVKPDVCNLVAEKRARFLSRDDFDVGDLGISFDFVFAHSVLAHCAHWQLGQFLRNSAKVLASNGRIIASIRLAEGNEWGSAGSPDKEDSLDTVWQYPANSFFKLDTVAWIANGIGFETINKPEYTQFYVQTRPLEFHDWLVFSRCSSAR